jgi:hypothetical protein
MVKVIARSEYPTFRSNVFASAGRQRGELHWQRPVPKPDAINVRSLHSEQQFDG